MNIEEQKYQLLKEQTKELSREDKLNFRANLKAMYCDKLFGELTDDFLIRELSIETVEELLGKKLDKFIFNEYGKYNDFKDYVLLEVCLRLSERQANTKDKVAFNNKYFKFVFDDTKIVFDFAKQTFNKSPFFKKDSLYLDYNFDNLMEYIYEKLIVDCKVNRHNHISNLEFYNVMNKYIN